MSILGKIKDAVTSDWKLISEEYVYITGRSDSGPTVTGGVVRVYRVAVEKHQDTDVFRMVGIEKIDQDLVPDTYGAPDTISGEIVNLIGPNQPISIYNIDYLVDEYNIDTVDI